MQRERRAVSPVALAFDQIAASYDAVFTHSAIGKSQRGVVWKRLLSVFTPGSHILELNCGTGQDALFMARAGMSVTACDASHGMIEQARHQMKIRNSTAAVEFLPLATEELEALPNNARFDGVFSNFSGLNCIRDLSSISPVLARLLRPGAPLLVCLSTRLCIWEIAYFVLQGKLRKALRRCFGTSEARLGAHCFRVYYPTLRQLRHAFASEFQLVSATGIGIAVPPSYLESWAANHPHLLGLLEAVDDCVRQWPIFRVLGDHMLLHFERVSTC